MISMRYLSLFVLTFQTAVTVLIIRYTRKSTKGEELYIASTQVLLMELLKFALLWALLLYQNSGSLTRAVKTFKIEVLQNPGETIKLAIPSSLYTLHNNLAVLALSYLDAATFQLTYQLKILTAAIFAVILLRRRISSVQWLSLFLLTVGVALVQVPSIKGGDDEGKRIDISTAEAAQQKVVGLLAVLTSSVCSGFAGTYYEKLLKESEQPSIVIRNLQLGIFSILFGIAAVYLSPDWDKVVRLGFFVGYSPIVWLVVFLQATSGLIVAAVIKYADNILKGFATSISVVLSSLVSFAVFNDLRLEVAFILGAGLVIAATFLYGTNPKKPPHQLGESQDEVKIETIIRNKE